MARKKKPNFVVVLIDDLDRCLPNTAIETLEAIRLFLSTAERKCIGVWSAPHNQSRSIRRPAST